ncbi:MAG TPA: glycerol-3-phosphate dehydrogenase/oxidase [Kofleriaceae bacterium]|nr:glycerol-3-phosphate dehydrogenase/oxidase [Kofleriaceae bacterium]
MEHDATTHDGASNGQPPFDVVVVGGGITGAGIARDAALRGLRVALCEKRDFGAGTSSKSSKLVHGGLRYLEHGEIGLVFESVSERRVQQQVAPHLVEPLPFLVPIYKGAKPGLEMMNLGLWIYDTLALFRSPRLHRTYRGEAAAKLSPGLRKEGLRGVIEYYDCITDDARLVLENIIDAEALGATCLSHTEVTGLSRDSHGRVRAVHARDGLTGEEKTLPCAAVIVAAGPWTDAVARALGLDLPVRIIRPTKGVHAVFPRECLPLSRTVTMMSPADGRVMFAIPWRGRTVLGTTDTDFSGSPDEVFATLDDIRYLCDGARSFFPDADLFPERAIATWAGLRPLIAEGTEGGIIDESDVSREHQVFTGDGVVIIAGGKLTTYRLMAREAVDTTLQMIADSGSDAFEGRRISRRSRTKRRPLPGAATLSEASARGVAEVAEALVAGGGIDADIATHLARTYGSRAPEVAGRMTDPALSGRMVRDLPHVWAEVAFAIEVDRARTVEDVLARRVPLLLVDADQGTGVAARTADLCGELFGWSPAERQRRLDEYLAEVALSRRFRADLDRPVTSPHLSGHVDSGVMRGSITDR